MDGGPGGLPHLGLPQPLIDEYLRNRNKSRADEDGTIDYGLDLVERYITETDRDFYGNTDLSHPMTILKGQEQVNMLTTDTSAGRKITVDWITSSNAPYDEAERAAC